MPFPQAHALLIGVGTYIHASRYNVPTTAADAQALATLVQDEQFCGYPPDQVALLTDAQATRADILAALERLSQTSVDDTVFLFYSGHGEYDRSGTYTLTTHDTQWQDRRVVTGTGISQAELLTTLRAIPASRVLLIFNACHAGHLSPTLGDEAPPTGHALPEQTANALLATGSGRVVITACRENQVAFVGSGEHTLFAQALLEGLRGGGDVYNRNGYISVFDLYTHLYYTLDEAVPRLVPQFVRDRYGSKQEPELTILKGVGPFAVARYHGATTLGDFPADQSPLDRETAVREVAPGRSQRAFQNISGTVTIQGDNSGQSVGINYGTLSQNQQTINNQAPNQGAQGNFQGPVTFNQSGTTFDQRGQQIRGDQYNASRDIVQAGRDVTQVRGDYVHGDKVGGDKIQGDITIGDVSGAGIAIGHKAQSSVRNVDTSGGDYAEGNIDKRAGTFVSGDQFTMSGNFSGAMLNIKSTLSNVTQSIGAAPHGDEATKAQLQALIAQLSAELLQVPAEHANDAEAVAETAKAMVEQATKAQPNKQLVQISAEGLQQAAQNLAAVLPTVLPLAQKIAEALRTVAGI